MKYLIHAIDHDDVSEQRESLRDEHRRHLKSMGAKLLASGALLADDGETVIGGISLIEVDSRDEAEAFASQDPYSKAGIRKQTDIVLWRRRWQDGEFVGDIA